MSQVFILAPTPVARAGLRAMLASGDPGITLEVVGEAATLDGPATGLSGAEVILVSDESLLEEAIRAATVETAGEEGVSGIVVLAEDGGPVPVLRGLSLPGWGIVTPDAPPEELAAAVFAAARGLVAVPLALGELLLAGAGPAEEAEEAGELDEPLTVRERQVLELIGQGLSNREISRDLYISEHTVKFHISSVYAKLGVGSRTAAVNRGARQGLISL